MRLHFGRVLPAVVVLGLLLGAVNGCGQKKSTGRLVVIGLDGATWDLLQPWIDAGDLPTLARVQHEWAWGNLQSVMPYLSPAAWTTAVTGVNPGKHAVYDFQRRVPGETAVVNENAKSRRAHPVWNMLSSAGRRVLLINIPMTDPPDEVNGLMIAGFPHPDKTGFTFPPELEAKLGDYPLDGLEMRIRDGEEDSIFAETVRVTDLRGKVVLDWLKNEPFDLLWAVFTGTDHIQHMYWKFSDPANPLYNAEKASRYGKAIHDFWVHQDALLGEILAAVPADASVMVLSDHGFGPLRFDAHVPEYLRRPGGALTEKEAQAVLSLDPGDACRLFVAQKGRDPGAPFSPDEARRIRARLIAELRAWKDPVTGVNVCEQIWTNDELFHGVYAEKGPDVIVLPAEGYMLTMRAAPMIAGRDFIGPHGPQLSGWHRMTGIYALRGPAIMPGRRDGESGRAYSLLDVAPTALYLLGQPIPEGLDGALMRDVIDGRQLSAHPPKTTPPLEEDYREMTPEELQNLKNLPYIGG